MDPKDEQPFNREPWRRLLSADSGAPTQDTDRRVLSEAQRALTPRVGRWWLPASLAASLLLAVLIVQWQLADSGAPAHVTESDVMSAPAPIATDEAAPAPAMESANPATNPPPPVLDSPTLDLRRASAAPQVARSTADAVATAAPAPAPAQGQAGAESAVTTGMLKEKESYAESRTPEEWYADIEALRTVGRIKEADAELARFKSEYPGWLERHQQQNP
jgi:hypothetical protein